MFSILITGSAKGIGRAAAELARRAYRVVATARTLAGSPGVRGRRGAPYRWEAAAPARRVRSEP